MNRQFMLGTALTMMTVGLSAVTATSAASATADPNRPVHVRQLASEYIHAHNAQLLTVPEAVARSTEAIEGMKLSDDLASREAADLAELRDRRDRLAAIGETYRAAHTVVTVLDRDRSGDELVARVQESTRLEYANVRKNEPRTTKFTVERDFSFWWSGTHWLLTEVQLVHRAGVAPVNEVAPFSNQSPYTGSDDAERASVQHPNLQSQRKHGKAVASTDGVLASTMSYDYPAMADYARRYWADYNPSYRAYGNDCTNFISQAVRAGGWGFVGSGYFGRKRSDQWYYGSFSTTTSYTWAGAHNWYFFATGSRRTYILSNVWYMGVGDVLQIDFDRDGHIDHSMIVTGKGSSGERYLTYHTNNTLNRSLSSIIRAYPSAWYYAHRT